MDNLLQQLPSPYILLGDFNGHNILWGGQNNDSRGELIENFITKNDICIMNDKSYTYHSPSTKSFTSIDLSFCHPSLFLDYNWSVCEDKHNNDHFPIIIEQNTFSTEDHNPNKLYLNSKDLQIPTISMISKYIELKPIEQLNFRSVSQGDLMFRISIIKHLLKRFGI